MGPGKRLLVFSMDFANLGAGPPGAVRPAGPPGAVRPASPSESK